MKFLLLFFSFFSCLYSENFYYFIPPKNWKLVDPTKLSKTIDVAFVENSKKPFKPSINLGIEKANIALDKYVLAAKKQITANKSNQWRELGYIVNKSGKAHLAQIDSKNSCGDIRSIQSIFVNQGSIFILTAVALKEDFEDYLNTFIAAFESFCIKENALCSLSQAKAEVLEKKIVAIQNAWKNLKSDQSKKLSDETLFFDKTFQKKYWKPFEKYLLKSHKEMGLFWQIRTSKELKESLTQREKA
jgi:hypothetical protein